MPVMNMIQALNSAMDVMLARNSDVVIFGEDVGYFGGVFRATEGLQKKYGLNRIFDAPIAEGGIIGTAMGIAYAGGRPVAEIQFCDYGFNTIDLLKVAGNQRWAGAGNFDLPMVVMMPSGSGIRGSLYHSHSFESWASRLVGYNTESSSRRGASWREALLCAHGEVYRKSCNKDIKIT